MLTAYSASGSVGSALDHAAIHWIDLLDPTGAEIAQVERQFALKLPTRDDLGEIESSSRVSERDGALFLSIPAVAHAAAPDALPSPVGFVLSKDLLVTVRFAPLRSFDVVAASSGKGGAATGVEAFAALVDEMVDVNADVFEEMGAELDALSRTIFAKPVGKRSQRKSNDALRNVLIEIGNASERLSRARDCALGLQRIIPFVSRPDRDWVPAAIRTRLTTAQGDLLSLTDYGSHLYTKVQFLLDAALGFITTRQNDIFQLLTIVSVVGIPPTLVASMYGMNFKNMPEYSWAWGYQYGLTLIVVSAIVPLLWFKWRRWI